jgi:hypothetical protein
MHTYLYADGLLIDSNISTVIPCPPNPLKILATPVKNSTLSLAPVCFTPSLYMAKKKHK